MTLAADFAWDCLNDQRYEEALDIFERLLDLEVSAVPDDFDFLGLEELNGENITNLDLTRLALSVLYADYQLTKPEERAESLYSYFIYSIFRDIHVEDILRMGREELDGLDRFWEDWIALLETKAEQTATRLLREAALYYGGTEGLARIAARNFHSHPSIACSVMEEYQKIHAYQEMLRFAETAMKEMGAGTGGRGEIAQKAAFAASCENMPEETRRYCCEAFCDLYDVKTFLRTGLNLFLLYLYQGKMPAKAIGAIPSGRWRLIFPVC